MSYLRKILRKTCVETDLKSDIELGMRYLIIGFLKQTKNIVTIGNKSKIESENKVKNNFSYFPNKLVKLLDKSF